jgi:DNA gyrase subunit B
MREILRRATDNVVVEAGEARLEGSELRAFLMAVDEHQQMFKRVERKLRDARVVDIVADASLRLDLKADFVEEANLVGVVERLAALSLSPELKADEEHSAWMVTYRDHANAERSIGLELASQAEYKRLRSLSKQIARLNQPPFVVVKDSVRVKQENCTELLAHMKAEGMRDASVQRYKGLGEMNAEQLWNTTMNSETRTLLQVRLEDAVECENIFSTLMGENVENRRKFIEENALDVRNLDL